MRQPFGLFSSTFRDYSGPRPNSMTFQAWKLWILNSTTFHDFPGSVRTLHILQAHNRLGLVPKGLTREPPCNAAVRLFTHQKFARWCPMSCIRHCRKILMRTLRWHDDDDDDGYCCCCCCYYYFFWFLFNQPTRLLGGVTVRASDLRSSSRGFDSQLGCYQAT